MSRKREPVDNEMRGADFIVCIPAAGGLMFPDNVRAVCSHCGRSIQHRPSVPPKVRKVCTSCATAAFKEGEDELLITKQQWAELPTLCASLKKREMN